MDVPVVTWEVFDYRDSKTEELPKRTLSPHSNERKSTDYRVLSRATPHDTTRETRSRSGKRYGQEPERDEHAPLIGRE